MERTTCAFTPPAEQEIAPAWIAAHAQYVRRRYSHTVNEALRILPLAVSLLLAGCEDPVGSRHIGVFRGSGNGFEEFIIVRDGKPLTYTHSVKRNGKLVLEENGQATLEGHELELTPFTRYIDSATGMPLGTPQRFINDSVWFLGAPPFDMLKPFPEHDYFLRKQPK